MIIRVSPPVITLEVTIIREPGDNWPDSGIGLGRYVTEVLIPVEIQPDGTVYTELPVIKEIRDDNRPGELIRSEWGYGNAGPLQDVLMQAAEKAAREACAEWHRMHATASNGGNRHD